jgi:DNA-binding NarL/FixJ family response regulator
LRALLVDDHPLIITGFQIALKSHFPHCEVTAASTLAGAREAIQQSTFDFAIIDINLPDGRAGELFSDP